MDFLEQRTGTSCFVYACANCYIHLNKKYPTDKMMYDAMNLAKCFNGGTLGPEKVVDYFNLPMFPTSNGQEVLDTAGIITIMHPIWNGHALFVYEQSKEHVIAINSWLGPKVGQFTKEELSRFMRANLGKFWCVKDYGQKE